MNYDPNKAIRQALMVARRQAAYGGQQSYPGYRPINPLTGLPEDEGVQVVGSSDARPIGGGISGGGNDPGTPGPPGAPSTGNFGRDVAGFAEAAGPALGGMAIGGLMGGPAGAVMGGVASTMAQGLAEATGLSNPASAPPGGFASVAGNIAQTQMGMQPTSNPVDAVTAAVTGPQAPADQEDADQGNAQAAADAAAAAAAAADNANSMSEAATADASADSDGGSNGDSGDAGGDGDGGGGGGFARGGDVKGGMDPRSLPGIHLKTNHRFADGGAAPGIGGGTFAGPKYPDIQRLANAHDKFIYHSGVIDDYDQMKHYLEPQHGGWIQELANHAGDVEPEEILDRATPLVWFSDTPSWVAMKVARKLQKPVSGVSEDEIRQHGHLALVPRKGDHAEHIYRIGDDGLSNGPYSNVTTLSGESKKAYDTDLYDEGKEPFGVERNEYVSARDVEPLLHLTGDHLVNFLKAVKQKKAGNVASRAAGGPVEEEEGFDAYHGSPHEFEQFDSSKIGTGEGAQAFGYGHYLAENEGVARNYRDALSGNLVTPEGEKTNWQSRGSKYLGSSSLQQSMDKKLSGDSAIRDAMQDLHFNAGLMERKDIKQRYYDAANSLGSMLGKQWKIDPGHMYHVRVKAKPEHFLDWDAPLSEQHPHIQNILNNKFQDVVDGINFFKSESENKNHDGANFYNYFANLGDAEDASESLRKAGIPGIKYFDRDSRGEGKGTRNYVIFDPDMIQVKRRYADGGEIMPQRDLGADPSVRRAMDVTAPFSVSNQMSVFPKPQRMWEDQRPGGAYLAMPTKEDITGHKAAQAEIGVNPGGKPFFNVSRDAVEETGSPGRGSATVKTNLFKQKAGWQWAQAPEGHENTNTLVSINHRGKHHYALNAQFPKGVDLARYENAPTEPRLRPTTKGNVELGEQVGTIMVRGKEHPVYRNAIVRNAGGAVGYADGGMPGDDPTVQQAMDITRQVQPSAPQLARQAMQSPKLASTFQAENRPSVIVSPRPGKVGGPPVQREMPEGLSEDFTQEREPWSFATPNIIGTSQPPPIQHPVFNEPRMEKITNATRQIFKNKEFHNLINDLTGLKGLTVTPTVGTWMNEMEPSFILSHPDMTDEHARTLAHLLGFGFQQDATVQVKHNPNTEDGIPAALIGASKKLTPEQVDAIHREATKHGMDFTVTGDGKAAKFLHFGDEDGLSDFFGKVKGIADVAKLPELYHAKTTGDLIDAQNYLNGIFGSSGGEARLQTGTGRSPDLFRRIVDHVLAPYAKAVAGEGYRLSPERLAQTYALNDDEREYSRTALYPGKKDDRTTVPLMTGEEQLDVRPTGERGRASVGDVLYALQNRAAAKGQIDPGDFSDAAKKDIAQNIAREVAYHVQNSDKSAIGWYDDALKGAMSQYSARFPELEADPEKRMLFHALLGITSQGNDVYSNSIHAMRLYDQVRSGEKSLPEAVSNLKGSFGDKTRAIESNLLKFHHLLENNGYDRMSDLFNQTKTVGEWNKILREDKTLRGPGDDQLKMQGGANQKVTGWMVFGPKIGSFINNLHGDYSTLTADLWFSRTWNRLLGHNFIHTPLAEAKQYRDFRDALRAEYYSSNPNVGAGAIPKTEDGKLVLTKNGQPESWEYGSDAPELSKEQFDDLLNDPDKMLSFAQDITKRYRDSQFKEKSDLRRRAKNWIENRELPVAAPRGDLERQFQQNTVEEAQGLLKKKYGMNISVADIQAALWFHEKELFGKLGVASEKAQPADYADAARRTNQLIDNGELYRVKSKEKAKKVKPQEEFASGGTTMPMRDSAVVDRALRLTSANRPMVALADLFQRQLRGRPPS